MIEYIKILIHEKNAQFVDKCHNKTNSFLKTTYRHFIFSTKYSSIYINTHRVIASLEVRNGLYEIRRKDKEGKNT